MHITGYHYVFYSLIAKTMDKIFWFELIFL